MGRNIAENTGETQTVFKDRPVAILLKDQRDPTLADDLNADGHDIIGARNVEAKTLNGKDVVSALGEVEKKVAECANFARKDHKHPEIDDLKALIAHKADREHSHPLEVHSHNLRDLQGTLPLSQIEHGTEILAVINAQFASLAHDHPELKADLAELKQQIASLPKPKEYSDAALRVEIAALKAEMTKLDKPAPAPVIDVRIEPVSVNRVATTADYLILESEPVGMSVVDSAGNAGLVKVTARTNKYLLRAEFAESPKFPVVYSFSQPPLLCGIGSTTNSKRS